MERQGPRFKVLGLNAIGISRIHQTLVEKVYNTFSFTAFLRTQTHHILDFRIWGPELRKNKCLLFESGQICSFCYNSNKKINMSNKDIWHASMIFQKVKELLQVVIHPWKE